MARDIDVDEAVRLLQKGSVRDFEKLNRVALSLHPGGMLSDSVDLEEEYGRFLYKVEIRDARGVQWDMELDAKTGQILGNRVDD